MRRVKLTDSKVIVLVVMTPVSSDSVLISDPERIHSQRMKENTTAAKSASNTKEIQNHPDLRKSLPNAILSSVPSQVTFRSPA